MNKKINTSILPSPAQRQTSSVSVSQSHRKYPFPFSISLTVGFGEAAPALVGNIEAQGLGQEGEGLLGEVLWVFVGVVGGLFVFV